MDEAGSGFDVVEEEGAGGEGGGVETWGGEGVGAGGEVGGEDEEAVEG